MPLSPALSTATITATYATWGGDPATGKVVFTPQGNVAASAGGVLLIPQVFTALLDNEDGTISVELPVGDTDYEAELTYLVEEKLNGSSSKFGRDPFYITLTSTDAGDTIDLISRTTTEPVADFSAYVPVTEAGAVDLGNSGTLAFGDANLYRSAANTLKTDDNLHVTLAFRHLGSTAGFFNATAVSKPAVSGARDETEGALASLLTALATLGLITDSTTAS